MTKVVYRCAHCPLYSLSREHPSECIHPEAPKFPQNVIGVKSAVQSVADWCPLKGKHFNLMLIANK